MATITLTIENRTDPNESAALAQGLKTSLAQVGGARILADETTPGEAGTKSGPASMLSFAMELASSPHTISAVGVVLFEWLRRHYSQTVELKVEGERIVVEHGSVKNVAELVTLLERKLKSNPDA